MPDHLAGQNTPDFFAERFHVWFPAAQTAIVLAIKHRREAQQHNLQLPAHQLSSARASAANL